MMPNTFILTWNPKAWDWPEADFARAVRTTSAGRMAHDQWSVGARRHGIATGDRALLLRQHSERGLVASGVFTGPIFLDRHWDGSDRQTTYAKIDWDTVLYPEDRMPTEDLKIAAPEVAWDRLQGSGVLVPPILAPYLDELWAAHLDASPIGGPDEPADDEAFVEGGVTIVRVNRYERDRRARQRCIEHWGTDCAVCGFSFEALYGQLGKDYVHVHHLRELAEIGESYKVDPVADLRPVCANCHAMLHQQRPALSLAALKRRLRA